MLKVAHASTRMGLVGVAVIAAFGTSGVVGIVNAPNVPLTDVVPSCTVPHHPGPGYNASITNQQDGQRICIGVGEKLLVFLTAPSPKAPRLAPDQCHTLRHLGYRSVELDVASGRDRHELPGGAQGRGRGHI